MIIIRTVVTTVDLLLSIAVLKAPDMADGHRKVFAALVLLNLAGVWI